MRHEILEDAQRLAGVGVKAVETKVNGETSDNDNIHKEKDKKRRQRKAIVKGKGKENTEMEVERGYNPELSS